MDGAELNRLIDQFGAHEKSGPIGGVAGAGANLAKLRAILDVARTPANRLVPAGRAQFRGGRGAGHHRRRARLPAAAQGRRTGDARGPQSPGRHAAGQRSARSAARDPARPRAAPRTALDELRSAGHRRVPARAQRGRPGTAQRHLRAAGAHQQGARRCHQRALHGRGNGRRALHGFAPGARRTWRAAIANCCKPWPSKPPRFWKMRACSRKSASSSGSRKNWTWRAPSSRACCRAACPAKAGSAPAAAAWPRTRWAAIITM